jgi:hypothetical protein
MTNQHHPTHPDRRLRHALLPAAFGLLVLGATACDVGDGSSTHPASADVDDSWKCVDGPDAARALGTVTNHSSGSSTYFLTISFGDGEEASATAEDVEAGETRQVEVVDHDVDDVEDCRVTAVDRFSA